MLINEYTVIEDPQNKDILGIIQKLINVLKRTPTYDTRVHTSITSTKIKLSFGYKSETEDYIDGTIIFSLMNLPIDSIDYRKINEKLSVLKTLCTGDYT